MNLIKHAVYPKFSFSLLHPRYWLTWLMFGILYLLVLLPYPVQYRLGCWLGRKSMRFLKRRVKIARRNIALCFPELSEDKRETLLIKNFESTGMALFETGIAWFWPTWRIKKIFTVEGFENTLEAKNKHRGILLIGLHFLTLEIGARIYGTLNPGVGVYRPNDNAVIDYLQIKGRIRSNKFLLDRKDIKGMIKALKQGEIIWYAPDHDYGRKNSVFVPFFHVEKAATTIGTSILVRQSNPAIVPFAPIRKDNGKGYRLVILPELKGFPVDDVEQAAQFINKAIEEVIRLAPEQYMWLHRRFKTRPEGKPSLYD